jgi:ATP-dependent Clp protease protease subunit
MKQIRIDGGIGDTVTAESFQAELDALELNNTEDLHLIINSPGGSVIEGYAIYNRLIALPNNVNVKVEGLAASIATLIALAGDRIEMSEVGMFMIHRASVMAMGNKNDLKKQAEILETIDNTLISVYSARTGMERNAIEAIFDEGDKFYDAHQAKEAGFIDEVVDKVDAAMAARMQENNKIYMKIKWKDFLNSLKAESTEEVVEKTEAVEEEVSTKELTIEAVNASVDGLAKQVADMSELVTNLLEFLNSKEEEEAKKEEVDVEAKVKESFDALLSNLPKTVGKVPAEANGELEKTTTWSSPFQGFSDHMKEIEKNTRLS